MLLLRHQVKVYRKENVTGEGIARKYSQSPIETVKCLIVPMSEKASAANGFELGQGYTILANVGANIKAGDKLESNLQSGLVLIANGVKNYENMPPVSHIEVAAIAEVS